MAQIRHIFPTLNLFSQKRLVFAKDPIGESLPTPEPYGDIESLHEAWAILQQAMNECDKRLKRITDEYGSEAEIPSEVKTAYMAYKKERADIDIEIKKLERRGINGAEAKESIDQETEDLAIRTLQELDGAFASYKQSEIGRPGDSMHGILTRVFDDTPIAHVPAKKTGGEKVADGADDDSPSTPESGPERRSHSKESPEYWAALYRDITKKIIAKATTDVEEPLSVEERTATMFMKGGETKTIILDGQKFLLERDILGKFLRLRNYWKENGKDDEEKGKEDPFMASSGAQGLTPIWKNLTETDLENRRKKKEAEKRDLAQERKEHEEKENEAELEAIRESAFEEIDWLFEESPAGSKVSIWHIISREQIEGTEQEKIVRMQVDLVKKYDGSVQASFMEQHLIQDAKRFLNQPETTRETNNYPAVNSDKLKKDLSRYISEDSEIIAIDSTPEEVDEERLAFVERRLDNLAGNLARASILSSEERVFRNDETGLNEIRSRNPGLIQWLGEIQMLADKENITDWEQNPDSGFMNRHVRISNGKISLLILNPEYEKYERIKNKGRKTPDPVPEQYLAVYENVRLPEHMLPPNKSGVNSESKIV